VKVTTVTPIGVQEIERERHPVKYNLDSKENMGQKRGLERTFMGGEICKHYPINDSISRTERTIIK
jgi:hypothetical protein